jgi:hypothetical protein
MAAAAMATGASLFETPNVDGETMTAFACGLGRMDELVAGALITLSPSKLALWMEYSFADLDKEPESERE